MRRRVIVYGKRPLAGHTKTRLGADLGADAAAGLYARLLYGYLFDLSRYPWQQTTLELAVPPEDRAFFEIAFPEFALTDQVSGDLGRRMFSSLLQALADGSEAAVLTGSDIPDLRAEHVAEALEALETVPVVLGPAADGGYYLVGMRAPGEDLFQGIAWSTPHVLEQTLALAQQQGLKVRLLPELADVDTEADYQQWRWERLR